MRVIAGILLSVCLASTVAAQDSVVTLGGAIRMALRNNPQVRADRHVAEQASARIAQARAALLPSLSGNVGNRQRTFNSAELGIAFPVLPGQRPLFDPNGEVLGPINIYDARIRLTQQLYSPSARAHVQSTIASSEAIVAESEAGHARIAMQAASMFVRLERAQAHVTARMEDSTLAFELLDIARGQFSAGTGISLDVTRAESQLAASHSQLISARAERARASLELARLLGLDLNVSVRPDVPHPADTANSLESSASAMQSSMQSSMQRGAERRAELRALDARIAAVRRLESAVRAERLPALSAFADNGMIGRSVDDLRYTYSWGLQLSLPLLDFRRSARTNEQSAVVRELEERRRDLERTIAVEVRSALIELDAARSQVNAARIRLGLGQRELQQARDRFVAGVAGNVDVVAASLSLNSARSALADAFAAQQSARVSLAYAQGTLAELR